VKPSRKTNGAGVQAEDTRICVVMVGLPARGKSLIAQKGNNFPTILYARC
jgi:6-phosphofructo-2-kinase/fructose-2,6-biphosphatase 2